VRGAPCAGFSRAWGRKSTDHTQTGHARALWCASQPWPCEAAAASLALQGTAHNTHQPTATWQACCCCPLPHSIPPQGGLYEHAWQQRHSGVHSAETVALHRYIMQAVCVHCMYKPQPHTTPHIKGNHATAQGQGVQCFPTANEPAASRLCLADAVRTSAHYASIVACGLAQDPADPATTPWLPRG
jgi:hypothetical protein